MTTGDRERDRALPRMLPRDPRTCLQEGMRNARAESAPPTTGRTGATSGDHTHVSHESIYQAVCARARGQLKVELLAALRRGGTCRVGLGERRRITANRQVIKDMVMLTERPPEADDRAVPGQWEGDLIMGAGNTSAIITLVERTSRYTILARVLYDHTAIRVAALLGVAMGRLPSLLKRSLAWDQGREMTEHASFSVATGIPVFFCDPHSRGSAARTRTPTLSCASTSPRAPTCPCTPRTTSTPSPSSSTADPRQTLDWLKPHAASTDRLLSDAHDALTG